MTPLCRHNATETGGCTVGFACFILKSSEMQETCTAPCLDQIESTCTKREIRHIKYQNIKGWIMAFAAAASWGRGAALERLLEALQSAEVLRYPPGTLGKALRSGISLAQRCWKRYSCSAPPSRRWVPLAEFGPRVFPRSLMARGSDLNVSRYYSSL